MNTFISINNLYIQVKEAYIDPGTGSMLFTVLIGLVSAMFFSFKGILIKIKYLFTKGKVETNNSYFTYTIYSDDKRYWSTFKPICDEFEKRKISVSYLTQTKNDPCFNETYEYVKCEYIGSGNKGIARLNLLESDIFLSTTPGLDVFQWKRSKNVKYYVHIPHAINDITMYRMFGTDYYDAVLVANRMQQDQIRKLESIRNIVKKDVNILGLPYFDELNKRKESLSKRENNIKNVLVAPSWGPSSLFNKYGDKLINELLKTNYHIILRPHPQSYSSEKEMLDRLMKEFPDTDRLEWNSDNDNFNVLAKSDILISDYSGVIFDYSFIFNKPIIYANTDIDYSPYDAWWLNEKFWTIEILPKIGRMITEKNINNIKNIVEDCINDEKLINDIIQVKNENWDNQGNSAKLIVDYLINKETDICGEVV